MTEPADIEYLTLEDLLALATALLGDPVPVRDIGLLGSAAARPVTLSASEGFDDYATASARLVDGVVTVKSACAEVGQGFVTLVGQIGRAAR